jgi:hypothetical protein
MTVGSMRLIEFFFGVFICVTALIAWNAPANSQVCPYRSGIRQPSNCLSNQNQMPIPSGVTGARMAAPNCVRTQVHAIASIFSYDDGSCHSVGSELVGGSRTLRFLRDAIDYFPPNYNRNYIAKSNFHASLYCDNATNSLILAFRGSVAITDLTNPNYVDDWFRTNLAQHLAIKPAQYQYAEDVAFLVKDQWDHAAFDGVCGSGRPALILAGHSKGGGEAQSASVINNLRAVVFNSDAVNPETFTDWLQVSFVDRVKDYLRHVGRPIQSILGCDTGTVSPDIKTYFASRNITDVRMTNDPLSVGLFFFCGDNLIHAPVEWLANTMTCSNDGHAIETVFQELQACSGP